jgi:hypothetical protein
VSRTAGDELNWVMKSLSTMLTLLGAPGLTLDLNCDGFTNIDDHGRSLLLKNPSMPSLGLSN